MRRGFGFPGFRTFVAAVSLSLVLALGPGLEALAKERPELFKGDAP